MFVCKKWLKLSNVCVPRWWDLRRYLRDINPVLLSVVLSVCLVCNSDLELVVNTVFSTNYDDYDDYYQKCCTHEQEFKPRETTCWGLGSRRLGRVKAGCRRGGMPERRAAGKSRRRELEAAESCGQGGESGARLLLVRGGEGRAQGWHRGDAPIGVRVHPKLPAPGGPGCSLQPREKPEEPGGFGRRSG